ncbi:RHS repeat-associated core domain-containing protein [Amycolatopsis lurida]
MTNPLVATTQDSTTAVSGAPLLESASDLKATIESGDWTAGALGVAGAGLDALGAAMDPFGTILSHGVGWLMEHIGPLKDALDALAGDPAQISAHADTWRNVAVELGAISADLTTMVTADTAGWTGAAADTYRARGADTTKLLAATQNAAEGAASGVRTAGELVAAVRGLVRDIIAELVGRMISWALQVLATFGIGTAWVVPQVARAVASTATKIADVTGKVVTALGELIPLLKRTGDVLGDVSGALRHIDAGAKTTPQALDALPSPKIADLPTSGGGGVRDVPSPDGAVVPPVTGGGTTPSSAPRSLRDRGNPAEHNIPIADRVLCADPIDVATGWMVLAQSDVEFSGTLSLTVSRTHISSYRFGRLFGPSWASTLDQRLEAEPDGLHLALADGSLLTFPVPSGTDPVVPDSGPRLRLWRDANGYVVGDPATDRLLFFGEGTERTMPLLAIGDADGNRVDIRYDDAGLPAELRHSAGYRLLVETSGGLVTALRLPGAETAIARYHYDTRGRLAEVVDAEGVPTRFTYDADGRIVRWEDRNGRWYRYGFDATGRCVRAEGSGGYLDCTLEYDRTNLVTRFTNSLGATTLYQLDDRLRVVGEVDPLGHTSTVDLDEYGRVRGRTDALGHTTTYQLDEAGNVVRVTRPDGGVALAEYDERDQPVTRTGPDGAVWRQEFDPRGKLVRTIDPLGAVTEYEYDDAGNVAVLTDALGGVTRIERDAAGLPVAVTDPLGAVTRYEYDEFGRTSAIIDPLGAVTRMRWAANGDLRERIEPDGSTWTWSGTAESNTEHAVDARGMVTSTEFGQFDLPIAETGPDGHRVARTYDTELRLVAVTNEQGLVWRYTYDAAGNVSGETDFNGRTTRYGYDAANRLVLIDRGAGETIHLDRDPLGRIVSRRAGTEISVFTYDGADRMISARNDTAEVVFTYDPLGRVVAESVNGRVVRSGYDALGRRISRRTPSGAESSFGYDAAGRPVEVRTGGRLLRFGYDECGRELSRWLDGGRTELRQHWDPQNRLIGQTLFSGDRITQRREYAYLRDGHLSAIADAISGPRALEVDETGRVRTVIGPGCREDYTYGPSGAITHAQWPARPDVAIGPRQYHGTLLTAAGDTVYRHDANGRTVQRRCRERTWSYHWNPDDRLTSVGTPDGWWWVYQYDPLGRRIAKQRLDGAGRVAERIDFTWDGPELAEEVRAGVIVVWDTEPGSGRPIAQLERHRNAPGERFHTIVTDLVGSPAELVDEAGEVAWHLHTTLWGKVLGEPGRAYTPLRFPGQYHDPETGLHYNFHRYYDPDTGRYLSHDPLGLEPAPDSLAYVGNPAHLIDPLGLTGVTPCAAGGGKRPRTDSTGASGSGPQPPKKAKASYDEGTHGAKNREQKRLTDLFANELKAPGGPAKQKVSGDTHQSEHPIGYEVLGRGSEAKRGAGEQQKLLENHAPAYQEELRSHREHIGTGTSSRTAESGFTAQSYRNSQRNALEAGDPNTAIQLNQLDYAHQKTFKDMTGTLPGNIADDSYHHMVDKAEGKGVTYSTGKGTNETTPPLSAHDTKELHAARDAARTGKFPEHKTYEQELAEIHERTYPKPTQRDWDALERGNYEEPVYDPKDADTD